MGRSSSPTMLRGRIGIALGSGGSRGWAHVGVFRALRESGIEPEIVAGCSSGAIAGAAYVADRLDDFERWGRRLDRRQVRALLDLSLRGGLIGGRRLLEQIRPYLPQGGIQQCGRLFGVVATDLESGEEVWLREGDAVEALRASTAIPGLVSPKKLDGRWLVDGALVNPVPISLCRALGADSVIAVDLNTVLLPRRFALDAPPAPPLPAFVATGAEPRTTSGWSMAQVLADLRGRLGVGVEPGEPKPGAFEVLWNALEIVQVRITRSRMAGDPPELLVTPRLNGFGLLDFHRAGEAIEEGRQAVARALAAVPWSGVA